MTNSDESELDALEALVRDKWRAPAGMRRKGRGCAQGSIEAKRLMSSNGGKARRKAPPVTLATSAKDFERNGE